MRFRLRHLLIAVAALSVLLTFAAYQWRKPLPTNSSLQMLHGGDQSHAILLLMIELPDVSVYFHDVPPYGQPDECTVYDRRPGRQGHYWFDGSAGNRISSLGHPTMSPAFERRYTKFYELFRERVSQLHRDHLDDPVKNSPDTKNWSEDKHFYIRLNRNRLEPDEPGIDHEYWTTPPEHW